MTNDKASNDSSQRSVVTPLHSDSKHTSISDQSPSTIGERPVGSSPSDPFGTRDVPFEGSARSSVFPGYELFDELGRGGMGIVYRARDTKRDRLVALKTLKGYSAAALYRFKREFRTLTNVAHPNLVALHELVSDGEHWCFTMELVEGTDFLTFIRSGLPDDKLLPADRLPRLRDAFRQLAEGLVGLHDAGLLHRDIKPRNVLIAPTGRVVILDFGLAAELGQSGWHQSTEQHVLGTIAYMSPEQAESRPVTPATDWYSFGIMLYEALVGRLPFTGTIVEVLREKQQRNATLPAEAATCCPEDLVRLVSDLLRCDFERRPNGREVLNSLRCLPNESFAEPVRVSTNAVGRDVLIGREAHYSALWSSFDEIKKGKTIVVSLAGKSGAGKTALARSFLEELSRNAHVAILSGRCYEQEAMPYKALDELIDGLSSYLRRLPTSEAKALLPRHAGAMTKIFPVLRRVDAIAGVSSDDGSDLQEVRRRAFIALRELLARIGDSKPLVLHIDDLQWADRDSAELLAEILRPPDSPVLLLIGGYRSEEIEQSAFLQAWHGLLNNFDASLAWRNIPIETLSRAEARLLAERLLDGAATFRPDVVDVIASESGGNPYFVQELVQRVSAGWTSDITDTSSDLTLENVLWERFGSLNDDSRSLLETLAVAGCPTLQEQALAAADLSSGETSAVSFLKSGRWIRNVGQSSDQVIETYHDRIRETIVAKLPDETRRRRHLRLAQTLELAEGTDPEQLARHFEGAEKPSQASGYYSAAGDRAAEALAFDRAADFYRRSLNLSVGTSDIALSRSLRIRLGKSLANAGRGREAAEQFKLGARTADRDEAFELNQLAAMHLLTSGQYLEGVEEMRRVLKSAGISMPKSPRRALIYVFWRELFLRFRGFRTAFREPSKIDPRELKKIDICWSATVGLVGIDFIYGAYFQALGLRMALSAGDRFRLIRAVAVQAGNISSMGGQHSARARRLFDYAASLIEDSDSRYLRGNLAMCRTASALLEGRYAEAKKHGEEAEPILRRDCSGLAWELDSLHLFYLQALTYLGDIPTLKRRWPELIRDARRRGNRYAETNLSLDVMAVVRLSDDMPDLALADLNKALAEWSYPGHHFQHHNALLARTYIHLYQGDGRTAWNHIESLQVAFKASCLSFVQQSRVDFLQLRARSALAIAGTCDERDRMLRLAEKDARTLEREGVEWAVAVAKSIRANIAQQRGRLDVAAVLFDEAIERLENANMLLFAAACRRRLGRLLNGERASTLIAEADRWMVANSIKNPIRMTAMHVPGLPD